MRLANRRLLSDIVAVYAAIYQDHYALTERAIAPSLETVREDLAQLSVPADALAKMNIFNVGTGREAVAFHKLGAKRVFHADLSPLAVRSLRTLAARDPAYSTIHSVQADICEPGARISKSNCIDLAYLNGVLHHLYDAAAALRNLLPLIDDNGILFLRFYRSGSFLFFVVDLLRRFIDNDDRMAFSTMMTNGAVFAADADPWLYSDLYDDLFVPVLNLFPPREVDLFMLSYGFAPVLPDETVADYNHGPESKAFVSAAYHRISGRPTGWCAADIRGDFPVSVDQLHGLMFRDPAIAETVALAELVLPRLVRLDSTSRLNLAISLYRLARHNGLSAGQRHAALRDLLQEVA